MPTQCVNVYALPGDVAPTELTNSAVVVIDLLRATTTISWALSSGAVEVVPFLEIADALAAVEGIDRSQVVLGGERHGGKIPGFDLGNSPSEYTPAAVAGKRVFITTTNGTRALHHARFAKRVLVGALVNLSAVAASIKDEPRVDILCAGTGGLATREDLLAAGAMVSRVTRLSANPFVKNSTADQAQEEWESIVAAAAASGRTISDEAAIELRNSTGGRNLLGIGLDQDLVDCAQVDCLRTVAELDIRAWRIVQQ